MVTSVGHQTTDTMTKFMNMTIPLVKALNPGTGVPFAVMRNGNPVKVSIARPSDSDLQPLTPSEQRVLDRQGGVISTATQEPERPQQQPMPKRRNRKNQNGGQQQNANSASGEMPIAAAGQIPNQQQNSQNGLNGGGVGLGLDGGGFWAASVEPPERREPPERERPARGRTAPPTPWWRHCMERHKINQEVRAVRLLRKATATDARGIISRIPALSVM